MDNKMHANLHFNSQMKLKWQIDGSRVTNACICVMASWRQNDCSRLVHLNNSAQNMFLDN